MTDGRQRQPASDETPHAIPQDAAVLAPPRQRAMPIPADSESKHRQRRLVHGHSVVAKVSTHNRPQPLALLGDGFVHASLELGFDLIQLRLQPFPNRLPQHREPSIALLLHADMRKAEKIERFRLPFSTPQPLVDRIRTELQQSRFLGMQLQVELLHAFREFRPKLIGIRLAVKSNHDVVRKTHHDNVAVRPLLTPRRRAADHGDDAGRGVVAHAGRGVQEGLEIGGFVLVADGIDVGDVGRSGGQRDAVGGRPATPMVKSSIETHFYVSFRERWSSPAISAEVSAAFCAPGVGSKFRNHRPPRRCRQRVHFHVSDHQHGRAASHVDLADGAGAGDRAGDRVAGRIGGGHGQLVGAVVELVAVIVLAVPGEGVAARVGGAGAGIDDRTAGIGDRRAWRWRRLLPRL